MADLSFMKQEWKMVSQGKVRSVYEPVEGNYEQPRIALVASDGVSAFDQKLGINIPDKGKILTKISALWFKFFEGRYNTAFLTADDEELPQYFQREEFKGRTTIMKKLRMIPIEAVMRGYITGSMWKAYQNGERMICGEEIPDGLANCEQLPYPLFTPTTKAPEGQHDENIDFCQMADIIDRANLGSSQGSLMTASIRDMSIGLFYDGSRYALQHGVILADTKFEFGIDVSGRLCLADELLTPDSSRFWDAEKYELGREQDSMDKQIIRNYLAAEKAAGREVDTIPQEILLQTKAAYENCLAKLFA